MTNTTKPDPKPMSGMKHFWLSFLAVVTGVPVSLMIVSAGFMLVSLFFVALVALSLGSSETSTSRFSYTTIQGDMTATNVIASVPVRGAILSGSAADPLQSLFGFSYADGELIKEQLIELASDENVKAVVLELDSPGGMINASKAIADGVAEYRKRTNKPIFTHINGMGASGGYWVASATDKIYAEQGSEAGSIGVIFGPLVNLKGVRAYGDVATNQDITFRYFSAGRSKDIGNPFRDMTPEEEAYLNAQLASEYDKFVNYVSERRGIPADTIKGEIGALSYGTSEAQRLRLIDGEASKEKVYDDLAQVAGVSDSYRVDQIQVEADIFGSLFGVKTLIQDLRMTESDKSAGRARFCSTHIFERPLVFDGDINALCK